MYAIRSYYAVGSREMFEDMARAIERDHIEPVVDKVFPWQDARTEPVLCGLMPRASASELVLLRHPHVVVDDLAVRRRAA